MSAIDIRTELKRLELERFDAQDIGLAAYPAYLADLEDEIAIHRAAYVGAAITEIATLRAELFGPQIG